MSKGRRSKELCKSCRRVEGRRSFVNHVEGSKVEGSGESLETTSTFDASKPSGSFELLRPSHLRPDFAEILRASSIPSHLRPDFAEILRPLSIPSIPSSSITSPATASSFDLRTFDVTWKAPSPPFDTFDPFEFNYKARN